MVRPRRSPIVRKDNCALYAAETIIEGRRPVGLMQFPFTIAIPAVRSGWAELNESVRAHRLCPLCDLPWICIGALVYLGKSCLLHHSPSSGTSFLDRGPELACHCPHCAHSRDHGQAA